MIPPQHKVRVVNQVIEEMGVDPFLAKYKGGGAGSYHPKMMLKVLVYGYSQKVWFQGSWPKQSRKTFISCGWLVEILLTLVP